MSEDNSWVFDSLVCFLHGPVWNAPLQTFIEEKSLIFDPNQDWDPENPEYKKIHDDYKNLVDFMLGSFMEEMHISVEQFEMACLEGPNIQNENAFSFRQGLFQQIWAANDIKIFTRMMVQKNVELQLQALDLIERKNNSKLYDISDSEQFEKYLELVEKKVEETEIKPESTEHVPVVRVELNRAGDVPSPIPVPGNSMESTNLENTGCERLNLFFDNKDEIKEADMKSRKEYLQAQRDKILDIKKKSRSKLLSDTVKKTGRPSSAQIAQEILDGNTEKISENAERNEASHQLRKVLAKRLRTEVVENQ